MKLIITIPKDKYRYIQKLEQGNTDYATTRMLYHAVKKGKPYLEQGEWISEKVDREDWKGCKRQFYQPISCSKCHSPNHYKSTYCPNCGAKMVESQETETWNGMHAQITAPKGTFERIFNDADDDNDI